MTKKSRFEASKNIEDIRNWFIEFKSYVLSNEYTEGKTKEFTDRCVELMTQNISLVRDEYRETRNEKLISKKDAFYLAMNSCFLGDSESAFEILANALKENPNAKVRMALGDMYYYGIGVKQDYDLAQKYYLEAANDDEERSIADVLSEEMLICAEDYEKGIVRKKDINMAIKSYENAFKLGSIEAALKLADIYYNGKGVSKNNELVREYFEKAANQGSLDLKYKPNYDKLNIAMSFNNLGYLFVDKDNQKALEYFKKAAALNCPQAFYHIGYMYAYGLGVEENKEEALKWLEQAEDYGIDEAQEAIEIINSKTK